MTNWEPALTRGETPLYHAIADALAEDVAAGRLAAGSRLPTHRDLAWRLGVTVGTVSRAYAEAERRGLVKGEVGRGTFVRSRTEPASLDTPFAASEARDHIALYVSRPPLAPAAELRAALEEVAREPEVETLLDYRPAKRTAAFQRAGARWLAGSGLTVEAERVLLTGGSHQGILTVLAALTRPGETILTEQLSFRSIREIARLLGLTVETVAIDEEGICPEALAKAMEGGRAKALYCVPNLQNPTCAVMSPARREEIAGLLRRQGLPIVEDDVFGRLFESPPHAISALVPELGYFVTGLSKCVAPGLRAGYLTGPTAMTERLMEKRAAISLALAPLPFEIATRWLESATAERILSAQRAELLRRREIALPVLEFWRPVCPPGSINLWIPLTEPWSPDAFAAEARVAGVGICPSRDFAMDDRPEPAGVRISLAAARDGAELLRAVTTLARLLSGAPEGRGRDVI